MFESNFSYYSRDYSSIRSAPMPSHLPFMLWCQHHHRSPADVNAHRKALNDIFAMLKIANRAGFTCTSKQPCDFAISQGFYFLETSHMAKFCEHKTLAKTFESKVSSHHREPLNKSAYLIFFFFLNHIKHMLLLTQNATVRRFF